MVFVLIYFIGWNIVDLIISIFILLIILRGGYKIIKNVLKVLMECVLDWYDIDEIMGVMKDVEGVIDIYEFYLWSVIIN